MEIIFSLINLILNIIHKTSYIGIFLGMAIESSFIPFPSEIIMIPAGALIAQGKLNFTFVFAMGIFGSLIGALINYFLAFYLGRTTINYILEKHKKILLINKSKLKKADEYFKEYGGITTFTGRLIPVIRQLISLPAGFTKMNLLKFSLFTSIGAGIWSLVLILIGYFFGSEIDSSIKFLVTISVLLITGIIILIYFIKKD